MPDSAAGEDVALEPLRQEHSSQTPTRFSFESRFNNWFVLEITGVIGSAVGILGVVVLLSILDGRELPHWQSISLNTVISLLSLFARACMAIPISNGLSQLKWAWFAQEKRPLGDLSTFDAASRGVLGSVGLLWLLKGRCLASVGAVATLLLLAFDPFLQNLVYYFPHEVEDQSHTSYLTNATSYEITGPREGRSNFYIDPVLKANVYNSLLNTDAVDTWHTPFFACPTGNCTWDAVVSLEMQASCADVTSFLDPTTCQDSETSRIRNCTVALPDGALLWYLDQRYATAWPMVIEVSTEFLDDGALTPLVYKDAPFFVTQQILAIGTNDPSNGGENTVVNNNTQFIATECSLQPIVRASSSSVRQNIYREATIVEWTEVTRENNGVDARGIVALSPPWQEEFGIPPATAYTISSNAWITLAEFLSVILNGHIEATGAVLEFTPLKTYSKTYATSDTLSAIFYGNFTSPFCSSTSQSQFACAMHNICAAISKTFRDATYLSVNRDWRAANATTGNTMVAKVFVRVRWQWLSLPVLVWVLATSTWVVTVCETRTARVPIWKDSLLPLLFLFREEGKNGVENDGVFEREGRREEDDESSYARQVESIPVVLRRRGRHYVLEE